MHGIMVMWWKWKLNKTNSEKHTKNTITVPYENPGVADELDTGADKALTISLPTWLHILYKIHEYNTFGWN